MTQEGKFAPKEFRAGLYRAAAAVTLAGLPGTTHAYWPEISSFVVRHVDALRAFVSEAYQNPKLIEIIDMIVKAAGQG